MMVRIILIVLCWQTILYHVSATDTWKYWWKSRLIYQIYPRSFQDSDGDGYGDINGIISRLDYLSDIGVGVILMSELFESASQDFYAVTNFTDIDPQLGSMEDFNVLKTQLEAKDMKLVIELDPNHSSDQHSWFTSSAVAEPSDQYKDFYVWRSGLYNKDGKIQPPNNWVNNAGDAAWEHHSERNLYYLHQFGVQQPDLNYRSENVILEMKNIITFWLDKKVDGIYIKNAAYLFEDIDFADEGEYHYQTQNQNETYDLIRSWRILLNDHPYYYLRLMIVEAHGNTYQSFQYYGTEDEPRAHISMNLQLIEDFNVNSTASDFNDIVNEMLERNSSGMWPNWVIGNLDNTRLATRLGPEMVDVMNMLNLLLPGTAFTYYGEELGMEDYSGNVTVPYPQRTPFLWDNSTNAGFSSNISLQVALNDNYKEVNLQKQKDTSRSHYNLYKKVANLRKTLQEEETSFTYYKDEAAFVFMRPIPTNVYYIVVVNFGDTNETIDLQKNCERISDYVEVYTSSVGSEKKEGDIIVSNNIVLTSKEGVVFRASLKPITSTTKTTTTTTTVEPCTGTSPARGTEAYAAIIILVTTSGLGLSVQNTI